MFETLHTVVWFIFAIALLIAVHEYGHFIVARKLGIKVEKFSIGFGPAIFKRRSRDGEVEYVIAAIPLGGYVKMLGENPDEQGEEAKRGISEADKLRAFDVQPVWKRASVAVAGPMFNFFFAIIAFMVVGWLGQSINLPVVGSVSPSSVAERAGFLSGDVVKEVDGHPVLSWAQMEEYLKGKVGQRVDFVLDRGGVNLSLSASLPQTERDPLLVDVASESLGIGVGMQIAVDSVVKDSPAAKAGLLPGDVILQIQGEPVASTHDFIAAIRKHAGDGLEINVQREDTVLTLLVIPEADGEGSGRIGAGLMPLLLAEPVLYRMGVVEGAAFGFSRTWDMTVLTLQVFKKMIVADISAKNLGGPIAIAQLAGRTAEIGLVAFISFLALISVNLAVLNLLPIPVLDGGHLVYLGIEKVLGRPVSPAVMEKTQMLGIMLIIMLMIFAFYNDISRLFRG